jgi:predicted O-methyltransferase YrrM
MIGEAAASHITGVPGWETSDEQEYLYTTARKFDGGNILEIGGEFGMSASLFSKGAPLAKIYSIDIRYDGPVGDAHKANLAEANLGTNVFRFSADSQKQATVDKIKKLIGAQSIDVLFIDGDHSITGAYNDLVLWSPLVKIGGVMLLHDTAATTNRMPHIMHFDVSHALAKWYKDNGANWQVIDNVNTITAFTRIE